MKLSKRGYILALFQAVAGSYSVYCYLTSNQHGQGLNILEVSIGILIGLLLLAAGLLLFWGKVMGRNISLTLQALSVPVILTASIQYKISYLLFFALGWQPPAVMTYQSAWGQADYAFSLGNFQYEIAGINIVALVLFFFALKTFRPSS